MRGNPNWKKGGKSPNPAGRPKTDAQKVQSFRVDGWMSALTGIGTKSHDKRLSYHFRKRSIDYMEAIEMWAGDDLARRAIESVPGECFRQGYEIVIGDEGKFDDLKEELEEAMRTLEVDEVVEKAYQYERAYGGGAILIGVTDGLTVDQPLDPKRVKSVDWLTVLEPIELQPFSYYTDPNNKKYGEPEIYTLSNYGVGARPGVIELRAAPPSHYIHESRVIIFGGIRVSRYQQQSNVAGSLWGDSVLTALYEVLSDFNVAWHSAGIIASDFAQSVISIDNLMGLVAANSDMLAKRMAAIELGRSTARAILIDTKEKYERQSTNLAGLSDLLDRLSMRLACAIDMPLALLMGQGPKGIGSGGGVSDDVRFYYDRIRGIQTRKIRPKLMRIAKLIIGTLGQKLPKKWGIRFNELWQLSDQEKAEARLTQARSDAMMIKMGVLYPDEVRVSRYKGEYSFETQIDESKKAPGMLELVPTAGGFAPGVAPPVPQDATQGTAPKGQGPLVSAAAKLPAKSHGVGGYVRRNPLRSKGIEMPKQGGDVTPSHRDTWNVDGFLDNLSQRLTDEQMLLVEEALNESVQVEELPVESSGSE